MSYLKQNLLQINENIAAAAEKSGRRADDITLVAVTKTIPTDQITEAASLGVTDFGENRVQEMLSKYDTVNDVISDAKWHMIGHLQTNKVKNIIDKVSLIHSVDSVRLANEINKRASQINKIMDILVEINIADEDTKQGVSVNEAYELIEQIGNMTNICLRGLMCVAPYVEDSEQNRRYFNKMNQIFIDIASKKVHNADMRFLSMGMTGDYQVAIEEGANIIRVGTGLFGMRI